MRICIISTRVKRRQFKVLLEKTYTSDGRVFCLEARWMRAPDGFDTQPLRRYADDLEGLLRKVRRRIHRW